MGQLAKLFTDEEWAALRQLPPSVIVVLTLVIFGVCWLVARAWFRHQITNSESTSKNHESIVKYRDAEIKSLHEENKKLKEDVARIEPQSPERYKLMSVTHGNSTVQGMFTDMADGKEVQLPTHPTDSSKWKHVIMSLSPAEFDQLIAARTLFFRTDWLR